MQLTGGQRDGDPRALPPRGAGRGPADASQHRRDLRFRRGRRRLVHRDGARQGPRAQGATSRRTSASRRRTSCASCRRSWRRSATRTAGRRPSRHQAVERLPAAGRHGEGRRLRHRAHRIVGADAGRHGARHAGVHVAGADPGPAGGRPLRSLLGRRHPLPVPHRRAPVHRQRDDHDAQGARGGSAAAVALQRADSRRDGRGRAHARSPRSPTSASRSAEEFAAALGAAAHAERDAQRRDDDDAAAEQQAGSVAGGLPRRRRRAERRTAAAAAGAAPKSQRAALADRRPRLSWSRSGSPSGSSCSGAPMRPTRRCRRRASPASTPPPATAAPPAAGAGAGAGAAAAPPPVAAAEDRSRRARDFGGRPRRSERGALPERQGADAERPARRFAQPARREGGRPAGRHGFGREELRSCSRQAPVAQRRLRHHRRARKRAGDRQGRPRVADDRSGGQRASAVQKSLNEMSRNERIEFIRASGDPRVAVRIVDARRRRARRAAAAVARRGEHPEGAHQVVRLPHVVGERRAHGTSRAPTSSSRARRRSSGCR